MLIVTGDIPFVTPKAVDDYARQCAALDVDCCYAAVSREACVTAFPQMKRTYFHDPETVVTGGNVVFQRVESYPRQAAVLEGGAPPAEEPAVPGPDDRSAQPAALRRARLTIADIEQAASRRLAVRCRIVVTPYASLGTDVDRPEDLRHARTLLSPP